MTKEEICAQSIIEQGGDCEGVYCEENNFKCPVFNICDGEGSNRVGKCVACEEYLKSISVDIPEQSEPIATLTSAIASLERSEKSAPESCRAEIRDIIEEVVYLRNRISQGVTK